MEFSCIQEHINKAVIKTSRILSTKPQLPILSSLLLKAEAGRIYVTATNLETTVMTSFPAKIVTEGTLCLPAKLVAEFISSLSKENLSVVVEQDIASFSCGRTKATIPGISSAEFPPQPAFSLSSGADISKKEFTDIVGSVLFSAAQDEARPLLMGVRLEKGDKKTIIAATDGYRLSVSSFPSEEIVSSASLIIPAKALSEVLRICGEEKETETMRLTETVDGQLVFSLDETHIATRRIDGEFPNYKRIIPTQFSTTAIVEREDILRAVKSAALFARESSGIIKISVKEDELEISANTPQVGENSVGIDAQISGDIVSVAINSRFVLDFLSTVKTQTVKIHFSGALTPVVFTIPDNEEYKHVIMPIRVQG